MNENDICMPYKNGDVKEATGYFETKAEDALIFGSRANDGEETVSLIFMNSYPLLSTENGAYNITGIEKRRVAAVSLSAGSALRFYESLKNIYERDNTKGS